MTSMTSTLAPPDVLRARCTSAPGSAEQDYEGQNAENREIAARQGWAATEYADKKSASRFAGPGGDEHREQWGRLLTDITGGLVDVLVLWEPSRGDRQLAGCATLLGMCRRHGVLIHITSHRKTYELTIAREWRSLAEDGIDSEFESEKIRMRVLSGKADGSRRVESHRHRPDRRQPPCGLRSAGTGGRSPTRPPALTPTAST